MCWLHVAPQLLNLLLLFSLLPHGLADLTGLLLCRAAIAADPGRLQRSRRALLSNVAQNRRDNELRSQLGTSHGILMAVRKGATADDTHSAAKDGLFMAKLVSSGSAAPSDFEPSGRRRRLLWGLLQGVGALPMADRLVGAAYGDVHQPAAATVQGGGRQRPGYTVVS